MSLADGMAWEKENTEGKSTYYSWYGVTGGLFTNGTTYKHKDGHVIADTGEHCRVDVNCGPWKFVEDPFIKREELLDLNEKVVTDVAQAAIDSSKGSIENSGGSCDYYKVLIENPTTALEQYIAECNDVIEALNMTYAEANIFKELWRSAAARTLGKLKAGHNEVRGAEKIVFFADRNLIQKGK